jgi:hypothetical protein
LDPAQFIPGKIATMSQLTLLCFLQ